MKGFDPFCRLTFPIALALLLTVVLIPFLPGKSYARPPGVETFEETTGLLPIQEIFDPLIADPRWPHFSASIQKYQDDEELENVGSANFGISFALFGLNGLGGKWQLGFQAGVFSIFDLDADSSDLINSDFRVGLPLSVRYGPFSVQARIFHQSSHLGDEYLLRNQVERIDLSYEAVDLLLSLDLGKVIRIYGGAGNIYNANPELEEESVQGGLELTIPYPLFGILYPFAAGDFQTFEENDWDDNYSARAGFELRSERFANRRLQIMFEYFSGHSPNGQFFEREIEYYGGGIHVHF
jgi:hypothetical protein